jgi:hypothetical protein
MEEKIYKLIKHYIFNPHVTAASVSLDLLNLVECQNVELIRSIIHGVEGYDSYDKALKELDRMIECYKK